MLRLKRKQFGLGSWGNTMYNTAMRRAGISAAQLRHGRIGRGLWNGALSVGQGTLGVGAKVVKGAGIVGAGTLALGGLGLAGLHSMATDG